MENEECGMSKTYTAKCFEYGSVENEECTRHKV